MKLIPRLAFLVALLLVAAGCGGGSDGFGVTTSSSTPATAPPVTATTVAQQSTTSSTTTTTTTIATDDTVSSTTVAQGAGAVTGVENVRSAIVQIVGTGTFQDPIAGVQANVPGAGTGFIIDSTGLAVTNNHVVTGAALLEVYFPGEDQPRNARVVGVSECSDLAVIDISGEGYDFLKWYEGDVVTGLEIFAAGYPLGDPEYTLLDGIVSKERTDGETTWASVDYTIEHSADTLPGNSGGPILTVDGAVVAVNYAGNQLGQSFAIAREEALPVIQTLSTGSDVDSIGVNGEAFVDGIFPGIWVYSVESGSPADAAGIEPGDLITRMEGLDLALDGTMSVYCDILRSHVATDVLAIEVYRQATDEILEGQLNSAALTPVFSFTQEVEGEVTIDQGEIDATAYDEYTDISDDSGQLVMRVPVEWSDTNGSPWVENEVELGVALSASPDRDAFFGGWDTPGVFVGATSQVTQTIPDRLDAANFSDSCDFAERLDYDDGLYQGLFDVWTNCGAPGSTFLVVIAEPAGGQFQTLVEIAIVEERDWDAADKIISSFEVLGTP